MLDLRNIGPDPLGNDTEYRMNMHAERGCDSSYGGAYTPQVTPVRLLHMRWDVASATAAVALRLAIENTVNGNVQVMYTPPNDPSSLRVASQPTIIGRLIPPVEMERESGGRFRLLVDLREDL